MRYKAAFLEFYGREPKIEVVGGRYRVDGAGSYLAGELDKLAARAEKMCLTKKKNKG